MKINLRPYSRDKNRWHVDIRLMHPCDPTREIRKRLAAPAGLSQAQARAWGERQVPTILRKELGPEATGEADPAKEVHDKHRNKNDRRAMGRAELTLAEFFATRFEPEHVQLQKPATQVSYDLSFRNHIRPHLGDLPLAAIDEAEISKFRASLRKKLSVTTTNLVLAHTAKLLRFAKRTRHLNAVPDVDKLPTPKRAPKAVYSDEEIAALLDASAAIDLSVELLCRLALEAGLRTSEICALEWGDVDLRAGTITVQHNTFRGAPQTPKGTIGKIALTSTLRRALAEHRRREPIGPLVLYRRSHLTIDEWRPHTPGSIRHALNRAQRKAGLPESGAHLLRHTMLTRLANLGASVYVVQAVARHSRLTTTQAYLHTQQVDLARTAAELMDNNAPTSRGGNTQATPATADEK